MNRITQISNASVLALCWAGCVSSIAQGQPATKKLGDFVVPGDSNRSAVYAGALFATGLLTFAEPISGKLFVSDERGKIRCEVKPGALSPGFHGASSIRTNGSLAAMLDQIDGKELRGRLTVFDSTCKTRNVLQVPVGRGQSLEILGSIGADWVVQRVTLAQQEGTMLHPETTRTYEFLRVNPVRKTVASLFQWKDEIARRIVTIGLHERALEPLYVQSPLMGLANDEIVEISTAVPTARFHSLDGERTRDLRLDRDTVRILSQERDSELDARYPETEDATSLTLRTVVSRLPMSVYKPIGRWTRVLPDGNLALVRAGKSSRALLADSLQIDIFDESSGRIVSSMLLPPGLEILDIDNNRVLVKQNTRSETKYDEVHHRFGARILIFGVVK